MSASPASGSDGPVTLTIKSAGTAIPDAVQVLSVATRAEMFRIPEAVIVIEDGDPATNTFPLADGTLFVPGSAIEIAAGYGEAEPETIFQGVVVALRLKIDGGRGPRLVVTCRDKAFKMTLGRRNALYENQKDSDIITTLAGAAGLSSDISASTTQHSALVQYRCTDWDYTLARAELNGMLVWAEAGKLFARPPAFSGAAVLTVSYGLDLIRFDAEIDARSQLTSVAALGWDIDSQATANGTASSGSDNQWGNLTGATLAEVGALASFGIETATPLPASDLQGVAKARQTRAELARLRGQVRFQGSASAKLGATLELAGLGARFNGTGLICAVLHRIENGDWTTDAGLGLDPDWRSDRDGLDSPGAAGLTAPARGLQIGKVTKLTEDPASQNRIQVNMLLLGADTTVWARLGGAHCTNGAGVMFLPEIGDEVVLGFFDEDPSHPVILGSLHSSTLPPPLTATAENYVKTIVTPKKLKVEFDDEKKKITLTTPAGNTVLLDDDGKTVKLTDQTGNKVELATAGITLDSPGDITIKATKGVKITAQADVAIQGMNVKATGQVGFSASGAASAELKASGTLKVQGALVQIN
jgi:Rhs element Vgr protein